MTAFADGAPCWVDALLPDLDAGKRFYGDLLGWTFSEGAAEFGGYTQAFRDGRKAAGLMPRQDDSMPAAWGIFFASSDIARTAEAIRRAGGRVVQDPMQVGELGTMLVAADPCGAVFGVWQAGTHQGFEVMDEPGGYVWMVLFTRDPEATDAFYADVFGFEDAPGSPLARPGLRTWRLPGQTREIGCRVVMDDSVPADLPSQFAVCFLVEDMDAAVRTATGRGGSVVTQPRGTPGGPFAVFLDDQGATFGVMAPKEPQGQQN